MTIHIDLIVDATPWLGWTEPARTVLTITSEGYGQIMDVSDWSVQAIQTHLQELEEWLN